MFRTFVVLLGLAICESALLGRDPSEPLRRVADARDSTSAVDAVAKYFSSPQDEASAKATPDESIQLFATWMRSAKKDHRSATKDERARLVGAIESIVGVQCPQPWIDIVYESDLASGRPRTPKSLQLAEAGEGYYSLSKGIKVENNAVTFHRDRTVVQLVEGRADDLKLSASVEAAFGPRGELGLIAFPSSVGSRYTVALVNTKTKKITWEQNVWASDIYTATGVMDFHHCFLVVKNDRCAVFGADQFSLYVEVFATETGRPLIRFNSRCWGQGVPPKAR